MSPEPETEHRMPVRRITVLIADDDRSVLDALTDLIGDADDLELVAAVGDADAAVRVGAEKHPDVAVLDVVMPGGGGIHAARELRRLSPETRVIGLSTFSDRTMAAAMLSAGAVRYLVKGDTTVDLLSEIAGAAGGPGEA